MIMTNNQPTIQPDIIATTLKAHGIKQFELLNDMHDHGTYISKTSLLNLIRYQQWPTRTSVLAIRKSLKRLLGDKLNQEELERMLLAAPNNKNNITAAYGVLPLLLKYGISQAQVRTAIKGTGIALSPSALSQILRHGVWPKTIAQDVIKAAIEKFMQKHITPSELMAMWQEVKPKRGSNKTIKTDVEKPCKPTLIFEQPEREMLYQKTMSHFNLTRHPFENEVHSIEDLFMSQSQRRVRESMVQASLNGSILAVIGECGAGKTELRKSFYDYANNHHPELLIIEAMVIDKKRLTAAMIFDALAEELQIKSMPNGLENRARKVERALKQSAKAGNKHVLVIEEAHDLSNAALKHLKRICELSDGFNRLVSVILVGQPELEIKLSLSNFDIREFSYRCNIMAMQPLGVSVADYIQHKLARCNVDYKKIITTDAIEAMKQRLQGVVQYGITKNNGTKDMTYPLMVNTLLVKAMNEAASICEPVITAELISMIK
jgi:type II secretory pathway predicted ATPase ExeA